MTTDLDTLNEAIRCIEVERTAIEREADAFRAFREKVSRAHPATGDAGTGASMARLAENYQETVMSATDYERTYGDTLDDSLHAELTPSLADALLADDKLTQRQKRDLLLATNRAIERREAFHEVLAEEQQSLQTIRTELQDITDTLDALPACFLAHQSFGDYIETWETTETLIDRCDRLLQARQATLTETTRPIRPASEDPHELSEYLYATLETTYPALGAIAETRQLIQHHRQPTATTGTRDRGTRPDGSRDNPTTLNSSSH